jgi:diguanylate cyclase (GGDEF)-like protein/PAS domain S-box-containing protein
MNGGVTLEFLRQLLDSSPDAMTICDARDVNEHVLMVNRRFEQLSGYSAADLIGTDLRQLLGAERNQAGYEQLRSAMQRSAGARAPVRQYRKDGKPFWCEVIMEPLRDATGSVTHHVSYFRVIEVRERAKQAAVTTAAAAQAIAAPTVASALEASLPQPRWVREDRLTGLTTRQSFQELLNMQWLQCQRQGHAMTLLMFEIDSLSSYRDTFDRVAVDSCVRKIARLLATAFRRGSDVVARWDEGVFCVIAQSVDVSVTAEYAQTIANRVAELQIHHPRGSRGRFISVSAGIARTVPAIDATADALTTLAAEAVRQARGRSDSNVAVQLGAEAHPAKAQPQRS